MKALYLDDLRQPIELPSSNIIEWVVVRNFEQFKQEIENNINNQYDYISFDNDLATDPIDGVYITEWLLNYFLDLELEFTSKITIHSDNTVAIDNMLSKFNTYYKVFNIDKKAEFYQWVYYIPK